MNKSVHKQGHNIIYMVIGIAILLYLVAKAIAIPVTIDESGTYYNYAQKSVWDIITYANYPSPNNHILNTLLIKLFTGVLGLSSLTIRLPNILAFVLFFTVLVVWLKQVRNEPWFVVLGIIVVLANPYLLDFFLLARGYGLSIGFMLCSLFYAYKYHANTTTANGVKTMIISAFAVYANFTLLNYFCCLFILLFIYEIAIGWEQPLRKFVKRIYPSLLIGVVLALLVYLPISKMIAADQFVYWGTAGFYNSTLIPLIDAIGYGASYSKPEYLHYFANAHVFIFFVVVILIVYHYIIQSKVVFNQFSTWLFVLFACVVLSIVLQFKLFGIPFLNARGALFLYPFFMMSLLLLFSDFVVPIQHFKRLYIMPIVLVAIIHIGNTINMQSVREWWFDAYTKEVISIVVDDSQNNQTSLNTSWIYNNSFRMHIEIGDCQNIKLAPFHNDIWADSNYTYYFCEKADLPQLENNYTAIKSYNYGNFVLLKQKPHN